MIKKITAEYFEEHYIVFDKRDENGIGTIRTSDGVFHLETANFPKYFEYEEPFDMHCCGSWYEVDKQKYKAYLKNSIEKKQAEIKELLAELND